MEIKFKELLKPEKIEIVEKTQDELRITRAKKEITSIDSNGGE